MQSRNGKIKQFYNSISKTDYEHFLFPEWNKQEGLHCPLVVEGAKGKSVYRFNRCAELSRNVLNNVSGSNSLKGVFGLIPKKPNRVDITFFASRSSVEQYLLNVKCKQFFHGVIVSENDYELTNSDMVYKLATPTQFLIFVG